MQRYNVVDGVEARAEESVLAVNKKLTDTLAELQFERNARQNREASDRREMQNVASEHNAAMLREALRVREEEAKAAVGLYKLNSSCCVALKRLSAYPYTYPYTYRCTYKSYVACQRLVSTLAPIK